MRRRGFLKTAGLSLIAGGAAGVREAKAQAGNWPMPGAYSPIRITDVRLFEVRTRADGGRSGIYVEILTDKDITGLHGPISRQQAFIIHTRLRSLLRDRDPLAGEMLWEAMRRQDRHARAGLMMMAISAVDNALWDLRGKYFDVPVYRLLGGPTRDAVRAYSSLLGYSTDPPEAARVAREYFDRGFTTQKWFFDYFPKDGAEGRQKNVALVRALREELGDGADLLFDARWGWDVPYALDMARAMMSWRPTWLEEPLHPEQIEGYVRIKRDTGIPLASGEHFYTRWNVKSYLDAGALDYVQADPEWCGGITELTKICALCDAYEVKVVPHGHCVPPAAHVVASQHINLCPMIEFLFRYQIEQVQYFQTNLFKPENGFLPLPQAPGLGWALDEDKIEQRRELLWE